MLAKLNREEFITLLNSLGQEVDDDVLTAARDLHARITVAGIDWDDLLVPEEDRDAEPEDGDDDYGEDDDDADNAEEDDIDDAEEDDIDDAEEDDADDNTNTALSAEQKKEAEDLIAAISGLEVSASTKEDMKEYKQDLADGEFDAMDLTYLRSLRARLGS